MAKDTQEKGCYKKLHEVSKTQWDYIVQPHVMGCYVQETIPVKWTAIEALTDKVFTNKSDV